MFYRVFSLTIIVKYGRLFGMNEIQVVSQRGWYELSVAPYGGSGIRCKECDQYLTMHDAYLVEICDEPVIELECGHAIETENAAWVDNVSVQKHSAVFADKEVVKNSYWYHATNVTEWHDKILHDNIMAHVGSEDAALSRAYYIASLSDADLLMYKLKLKESSKIEPDIILDEDDWSNNSLVNRHRVNRYVNMFESIGSISLLLHPSLFEIVSVTEI